jgi:hypothetical protein
MTTGSKLRTGIRAFGRRATTVAAVLIATVSIAGAAQVIPKDRLIAPDIIEVLPERPLPCPGNLVRTPNGCVCPGDTIRIGNTCIIPENVDQQPVPDEPVNNPPPKKRTTTIRTVTPNDEVRRIQVCLNLLGFFQGTQDGVSGPQTLTAFKAFQSANQLTARPVNLGDQPSLQILYKLCEPPPTDDRCVDEGYFNTYAALVAVPNQRIRPCNPGCIPKPENWTPSQISAMIVQRPGIRWCDDTCIRVGSYIPWQDVQLIMQRTKIRLCPVPPNWCWLPPEVNVFLGWITLWQSYPVVIGNEDKIAVIIANEHYGNGLPEHINGIRDGDAIHDLLVNHLGYKEANIIHVKDAKLSDLQRVFGTAANPGGEIRPRIDQNNPAGVFVYVSTHGLVKDDATGNKASYLLPVDGDTATPETTAMNMQELYSQLGKVGASSITVGLEGTFDELVNNLPMPPNVPSITFDPFPQVPVPGLQVLKATDANQHALEDPGYGLGLFTRYYIEGLAGAADLPPIGNGDGRIDTVELFVYTGNNVLAAAQGSLGMEQKPTMSKIDNILVGTLAR